MTTATMNVGTHLQFVMLYNTTVFLDVATTSNEITKSIGDHVPLQ